MVRVEHAQADRAWQAARGRAAMAAVDWLGKNPAARLLAMPSELRDGLSPEQTERLDMAAINGGHVATDLDLYDALDRQSVQEGRPDAAFERHGLGRTFLDEGLRKANFDPDGPEARTARRQLDRVLGAFETVEGKPPTMTDIRGVVGDVLRPLADDPNIVRVAGGDSAVPVNHDGSKPDAEVNARVSSSSFGRNLVDTAASNIEDVQPAASADDPQGLKMSRAAAQAAGLDKNQQQQFHRAISGQGITSFQELLSIARQIKAGTY
jgi:hypothetical protein